MFIELKCLDVTNLATKYVCVIIFGLRSLSKTQLIKIRDLHKMVTVGKSLSR